MVAHIYWKRLEVKRLNDVVNDAGGFVGFRSKTTIPLYLQPIFVEVSSGSHPVGQVLVQIRSFPSISTVALHTSDAGDHLLPDLIQLQHVEILDLRNSEITNQAARQILDSLPQLKELHLSSEYHSREDLSGEYPGRLYIEK